MPFGVCGHPAGQLPELGPRDQQAPGDLPSMVSGMEELGDGLELGVDIDEVRSAPALPVIKLTQPGDGLLHLLDQGRAHLPAAQGRSQSSRFGVHRGPHEFGQGRAAHRHEHSTIHQPSQQPVVCDGQGARQRPRYLHPDNRRDQE
ncbi:MAG: hypothetical protein ACRDRQ_15015 [Pseudonocardiaceae bacterium]